MGSWQNDWFGAQCSTSPQDTVDVCARQHWVLEWKGITSKMFHRNNQEMLCVAYVDIWHTYLRTEADWLFCSKVLVVHLQPHLCKPVLQPWQNSTSMQLMDANISVLLAQTLDTLYWVEVTTTASSTQTYGSSSAFWISLANFLMELWSVNSLLTRPAMRAFSSKNILRLKSSFGRKHRSTSPTT